jgi:protein-L-isoaspartate(D-aspartate) O-methyltransferase
MPDLVTTVAAALLLATWTGCGPTENTVTTQEAGAERPLAAEAPVEADGRPRAQEVDSAHMRRLRHEMVRRQIADRGIRDTAVLRVMRDVPRHRFVPPELSELAYHDGALPIGYGQTISQPYIVAFMAEAARLRPTDRVLEIGAGSGYGAAVLAGLASEVFTIEIVPELADGARRTLGDLGYRHVRVRTGNGWSGWPEHGPYDAVVVTAAPDEIPTALVEQLRPGGRLVIPVGGLFQTLRVMRKTPDGLVEEASLPVRFVPMVGEPPDTSAPPRSGGGPLPRRRPMS